MKKREALKSVLNIDIHDQPIGYVTLESVSLNGCTRQLIEYLGGEGDVIRAYLFIPSGQIRGSILVHHQHNGERHFGKSEVSGICGDPYQHFCEPLCKQGFVILAPDSICFEDRRSNKKGIEADDEDLDVLQHYNEMSYRILRGDTLMRKVIEDSSRAISILKYHESYIENALGILGHSYGGNTVIFHSALDIRIQYSCSSGAVGSYQNKFEHQTGIELAEVIPGFVSKYDLIDLLECICPRHLLIAAGSQDIYALDAANLYKEVMKCYKEVLQEESLSLQLYEGGHALNAERFEAIIKWFVDEMP